MIIETGLQELLELMDRPAFCVGEGGILAVNQAARDLGIMPRMDPASLLRTGLDEYQAFTEGTLFLTVQAGGLVHTARVTKLGDHRLFALASENAEPHLQALGLAAQQMRLPLHQVMTQLELLMPGLEDGADRICADRLQRMNQGLYQLLRLVGNMSDASTAGAGRMEILDLTAVMAEIGERAAALCQAAGANLTFENHPASVLSLADSQKLERAVYNLLSNALGNTPAGGRISLRFARHGRLAQITVANDLAEGAGMPEPGDFERYLRLPGIGGAKGGLGLGMTLVRAVAAAHQGSLLLRTVDGRMEAALNLPIRQDTGTLRSPAIRIDYAGEQDHGLIELSEFLPPEYYSSKK